MFCAILDVEPSHIKFWIMLFISLIAFKGVLITRETYINVASAKLLRTVIFPLRDSFLLFQMFKLDFKFDIFCWKLYL